MRLSHFVRLSGALILTTGLAGVASAQSYSASQNGYSAHEACKSSETRGKYIGGGIGAVAGAVIGSQVAGSGARTEASVIGGVLGGLAGAGIADKRVDCDPVYSGGYQTSSNSTYSSSPSSTTYSSSPTYSTAQSSGYHQTSSYTQTDYGVRTTVSDHPVYSNPTWGAQPARTYVSQPVSQPVYSQPTYQSASYSQPQYTSSATTHYARPATTTYVQPTRTYVQPATTYVQPRTTYAQPATYVRSHRAARRHGAHHHGRFACSDRH